MTMVGGAAKPDYLPRRRAGTSAEVPLRMAPVTLPVTDPRPADPPCC